uniref:Uncharacterized protein n=1 Tax=Anguilla anguilla TaxID=7936 RepID=A0A0E9PHH5_ANGAN
MHSPLVCSIFSLLTTFIYCSKKRLYMYRLRLYLKVLQEKATGK